jgi:N-acetylmuramic acid 6-phosphate etherase
VFQYDRHKKWGSLGERVLRHLLLNHPNDLVAWAQSASKSEIAALAPCVFESRPDSVAKTAIDNAADALAKDAAICAARIASRRDEVQFVLAGGMLLKQPHFAKAVAKRIRRQWPFARIQPLKNEGAWGAARMARQAAVGQVQSPDRAVRAEDQSAVYVPDFVPENSPTEQRNPASTRLHELSTGKIVGVMLRAESDVIPALRKQRMQIVRAVEMAAQTLKAGGRIFYVGAGTSGRLGVLDASECPPTFLASPEMIQGLIAGGQRALWQAVEGAEDDAEAGATALRMRGVSRRDLVIGIAASGRTPFVWGALGMSRQLKAKTILLSFNPALKINPKQRPDLVIAPDVGPEILTGSTRLKSGTATKLVLNMISTISMVRMGKVIGNLMIDLNPSNVKLRNRAVRIVQQLTGVSEEKARDALERKHWVVKDAWIDLKRARAR